MTHSKGRSPMLVPGIIEIVAGLGLVWLAVVSWQERLPRNGIAGVRTPSTMRSDEAFRTANKVAAPLTGAAGVVMAAGGVVATVVPESAVAAPLLAGALGAALLAVIGGIRGARAAR
jgi:uncharacterized membrane protein